MQEAVRELGFQPNPVARGLRKGRTGMIGLLVPDMLNPHFAEYGRQMQIIAHAAQYMLVLASYDYESDLVLSHLRTFSAHRVDGLIWMAGKLEGAALEVITAARLPTVVIDEPAPENIDHVRAFISGDTRDQATYEAVSRLIAQGHRRFAYLTEGPTLVAARGRLAAFRAALNDHGIPPDEALIKSTAYLQTHKLEGGYLITREILDGGRPPTAICALTDLIAIGVLRALRERGLRVPEDVSVLGCDDILQASYTAPPLTTIHTPYEAISAGVLKLVQHLIDPEIGEEPLPQPGITYTLVERASTGPAPAIEQGQI